jgi:hypothetical protein
MIRYLWLAVLAAFLAVAAFWPRSTRRAGIPCRDGTVSYAATTQGACSHHGGIRR